MDERPGLTRPSPTSSLSPKMFPGGPLVGLTSDRDGAAESAERLHTECGLRDALIAQGFGGPDYAALTAYGLELMTALVASGYIFTRCYEEGIYLLSLPIPISDQEDLVQETVAEALQTFDKSLKQGRWQPGRGASLKTYFTGALLLHFANIWRRWLRYRARQAGLPLETVSYDSGSPEPDPADIYVQRDEVRRALGSPEEARTKAALVLTEDGYTQQEIAEILGTTRRAVESLLRRHRIRVAATNEKGGSR